MIVVWTEGVGIKFIDAKRKQKKIDAKPGIICIFLRVSW